jgi:hypothetical protein
MISLPEIVLGIIKSYIMATKCVLTRKQNLTKVYSRPDGVNIPSWIDTSLKPSIISTGTLEIQSAM